MSTTASGKPDNVIPHARLPVAGDVAPVLELIAQGQSLRAACRAHGIHVPSMLTLLRSTDELDEQYARAKELRGEHYQEQALALSIAAATGQEFVGDGGTRNKIKAEGARVALDAIKWAVGRMTGRDGGVRRVEMSGSVGHLTDAELDEAIRREAARLAGGAEDG